MFLPPSKYGRTWWIVFSSDEKIKLVWTLNRFWRHRACSDVFVASSVNTLVRKHAIVCSDEFVTTRRNNYSSELAYIVTVWGKKKSNSVVIVRARREIIIMTVLSWNERLWRKLLSRRLLTVIDRESYIFCQRLRFDRKLNNDNNYFSMFII